MADGLDYPKDYPAPMDVAHDSSFLRPCALALLRSATWSLPAYSGAQVICGIGNRSAIHVCQVGSSRSTAALALSP